MTEKFQLIAQAELEKRRRGGTLDEQRTPLWTPIPDASKDEPHPQRLAMASQADELFFGGAPGGGKSDFLLGAAVTQHRNSIIFRREAKQLKGAEGLIARSEEVVGTRGELNKTESIWRKIDDFRTLEFGGVQHEDDKKKYQGRAHDLKAFDEITEFTESQYEYLIAWNRTKHKDQRCRVIAAGNPPTTPEGRWVVKRWAPWLNKEYPNPAKPGELRWFVNLNGKDTEVPGPEPVEDENGEMLEPKSRTFIPSKVEDNLYLMATGYKATLQRLPEPLRSILLNPDIGFGAVLTDDLWQVVPTTWIKNSMALWEEDERTQEWEETGGLEDQEPTAVGIDPARGGENEMAIAKRYGNWFAPIITIPGVEVPTGPIAAYHVTLNIEDEAEPLINIDAIGVGSSPYDSLDDKYAYVIPINVSESSTDYDKTGKFRLRNIRAAMYWGIREALDPDNEEPLLLPMNDDLLVQLAAHRYKITTSGILIESKEDIKNRLGSNMSPDLSDAVCLAHYEDEMEAEQMYYGRA